MLAGGLALFWQPGLEATQNSITSSMDISGELVSLIWLFLSFVWAFVGAMVGHSVSATVMFYFKSRRSPVEEGHRQ